MYVREMRDADIPSVLELINADRLPAQPLCGKQQLLDALAGREQIDTGWWRELERIQVVVALEGASVVGAGSFAVHTVRGDGEGMILWLHAREERVVIDALLEHMLRALRACPYVCAFWFATPLTFGVEALPVAHRPETHLALVDMGFTGKDEWLYMMGATESRCEVVAQVSEDEEGGWQLRVEEQGEVVGKAQVGLGPEQIGVLWWIGVNQSHQRRGLGGVLLQQARKVLCDIGARLVILYVDHGADDREAAIRLYTRAGFAVVDHLWQYRKDAPLL